MAAIQMLMQSGLATVTNLLNEYVSANWHRFYRGEMVSSTVQTITAGNSTLSRDNNTNNSYMTVFEPYSLSNVPLSFANSTIFYFEYKIDPFAGAQGGLSAAAPFSPTFGINTTTINNGNSGANTVYQEQHPDIANAYYFDGGQYQAASGIFQFEFDAPVIYDFRPILGTNASPPINGFGLQTRSLTVANVPYDCRTVTGARFYQNGFGTFSNSPSILVMPGSWTLVPGSDSGPTIFQPSKVGEILLSPPVDVTGFVMDQSSTTFSVQPGDLVIGTTMGTGVNSTEVHPNSIADGDNILPIYSWTRRRVLNANMVCTHGLSMWFSTVSKTYTVNRAINQLPGARYLVYRYNPNLIPSAPPPASAPPPPPPPPSGPGGGGSEGSIDDPNFNTQLN
jgi:hypothetical protein